MMMASLSSRESFLEKKVSLMEKRLTLLEKFVEAKLGGRFAFQDAAKWAYGDMGRLNEDVIPEGLKSRNRRRAEAAKRIASTRHAPDYDMTDPLASHDNDDLQSSSTSNSWVSCGDIGDEDDGPHIMPMYESPNKSRPGPLSVKKKLKQTEKVVVVAPQSYPEDVPGVAPKQRYNTRSKGKTAVGSNVDLGLEEIKVDIENDENESYHIDGRSEGRCFPANQDDLDQPHEYEDFDEELPETQPMGAEDIDVGHDTSNEVSSRPRRDRKRKLPEPDLDTSAEHSDNEYEPPRSENSDDDLDESRSEPSKNKGKAATSAGRRTEKRIRPKGKILRVPIDIPIVREGGTIKQCPECHKYIKIKQFSSHVNSHFKERNLKCPDCDKSYYSQNSFSKHLMTHKPDRYVTKCRLCGSQFSRSDKALSHERICVKRALERGEQVDDKLISDIKRRSLNNWAPEVAPIPISDPKFKKKCPYCQKTFATKLYQQHIKTKHKEEREWVCSLCDKSYFHKSGLIRHFASHHHLPSCDICTKTFDDKNELTSHMLECKKQKDSEENSLNDELDASEGADEVDKDKMELQQDDEPDVTPAEPETRSGHCLNVNVTNATAVGSILGNRESRIRLSRVSPNSKPSTNCESEQSLKETL